MSAAQKVGRNDPCSCGSGAKYKRCCLSKTETDERAYARDDAPLDDAEAQLAQQMIAFAEPVLRKEKDNPKGLKKALTFGAMCWDLALLDTDNAREQALTDCVEGLWKDDPNVTDEVRESFRSLARSMIERHREMFPEMHATRASSVVVAGAGGK